MMTIEQNAGHRRADQILRAFLKFHEENPEVWSLFRRFTFEAINSGRARYSSDAICHRIRWYTSIETRDREVKLNDHFTAYYARMFQAKYPQHTGFFETRRRISEKHEEYGTDIQVFKSGPPDAGEGELIELLRRAA